jgi:hypothetical protein
MNNFFDTSDTSLDSFWAWFQPDNSQKEEIEKLIQTIIQAKCLATTAALVGGEMKLAERIRDFNQDAHETSKLFISLFAALEKEYNDLVMAVIHSLNADELIDLQKCLEEG